MAKNPLEAKTSEDTMPLMLPNGEEIDPTEWCYRVGRYVINGSENDNTLEMELLMTRSISGDVLIVDRKDAISSVTGEYVAIIIYVERRRGDA